MSPQPNRSRNGARFEAKLGALQAAMREQGFSALLFYSSGQLSMVDVNPVFWISGALPMGADTAVLVTDSGAASILLGLPWDEGRVRAESWIMDVRYAPRFAGAVLELIEERHVAGKIGVAGWAFMPAALYKALERSLGSRIAPADSILAALARFPGQESLPALERAAAIADLGFAAILKEARVGMPEHELGAEVEYAMRRAGAEDNFGMVTASDHGHSTHPPSDRKIQKGDLIIAEITPAIEGQFVQLCRTVTVGRPAPVVREKFDIMEEAMARSLERARPGRKVGEVSRAMNEVFAAHGYEKYCRPPYMRVRGHGLGFLSIPFSEIVDENEALIEPGMSFVVHPNQYIPETGYLMLGDTVWIEAEGARRLARTPLELFAIEG